MNGFLALLLLGALPVVIALLLGVVQLAVYRVLVRRGRLPPSAVPFFPILVLRGLVVVVALAALAAIVQGLGSGLPGLK